MKKILDKLKESSISVLPVTVLVLILSFTSLAPLEWKERIAFSVSALGLIIGMALFSLGADLAMTPIGKHVGEGLSRSGRMGILVVICFVMGLMITVAEPDLSVLADQIGSVIPPMALIITVGVGVGLFLAIAVIRIITKTDLTALLLFFYMLLFAFAALMIASGKKAFLPLAFDSGGVTTGPITVPFIMALGIGIAQTIGGKNADQNSFGLISLCSVGPVLAVLILSLMADSGEIAYPVPEYSMGFGIDAAFLELLKETFLDVLRSVVLITAFFFTLNFFVFHLPKEKIFQISNGLILSLTGLVIFLVAVTDGFMPVGYKIGYTMTKNSTIATQAFSFVIGMVVVLAEPAVHVLTQQVEDVTRGSVSRRSMLIALSLGVGISIGLSFLRLLLGFSLLYYLVPGYLVSLGLSFFVPRIYTAIAFDSGGVASGPLTSSFILPMMIGACVSFRGAGAVMDFAFGVVSLVAMTPLITIQALSFKQIVARFMREKAAVKRIISADDDQIIYFE